MVSGIPDDLDGDKIDYMVGLVTSVKKEAYDKAVLSESTNLVIICNAAARFDPEPIKEYAMRVGGVKKENIQVIKGDKEAALDAIATAKPGTTVWFNGHGGENEILVSGGLGEKEPVVSIDTVDLAHAMISSKGMNAEGASR